MQANTAPAPADELEEEEFTEGETGKMHSKYSSFLKSIGYSWHTNEAVLSTGCKALEK